MSDSNRCDLYYAEELVWGTSPGGNFKTLNFTGEGLKKARGSKRSANISSDRQRRGSFPISIQAEGPVNYEMSYENLDDFLEGALWDSWVGVGGGSNETLTAGTTAGNLDFVLDATNNYVTIGSAHSANILAGQWIKLEGTSTDDGFHLVVAVTTVAGDLQCEVESITTSETLDETSSAVVSGARLRNGSTRKSYSIERRHADVSQHFMHLGMVVNGMTLSITTDSLITGNFTFLGKNVTRSNTSGAGTPTPEPSTDSMSAVTNVGTIREGGTPLAADLYLQQITLEINNNLAGRRAIANSGLVGTRTGPFDVSGTVNAYFVDGDLWDKFSANTSTGLDFTIADDAGNTFIYSVPEIKFIDDNVNASGENTDVRDNIRYEASKHATYGYTLQICRFTA